MTVREQIRAKQELRRLHALEVDLKRGWSGTQIASGPLCAEAAGAIDTANRLGYVVIVRRHAGGDGKGFVAAAYRIGGP